MDISTHKTKGYINVISISGDMDLYNSSELKDHFVAMWEREEKSFIVDLDNLNYLDSSGIGVLLYIYTTAQKRRMQVRFANVKGSVLNVIRLTKLHDFLPIADSVEEAAAYFPDAGEQPEEEDEHDRVKQLVVDPNHPLFNTAKMFHKEFNIDYRQIRRLSNLIAQKAPAELQEINMLEQQIRELIKNAVKHGKKKKKNKTVKIWFSFSPVRARLIVEDEGEGFKDLEKWNEFYKKRVDCYQNQKFDEMMDYLAFRTEESDDTDGGNSMFAAVEYWNEGVVFNERRNAVAVGKHFD